MNLESLRRRRVRRTGAKLNPYASRRRIFFVLDRATRRFHGDIGLWMQYAEFARKEKANRKLLQIMTDVLRLHPTKPDLWVYAAKYALDVQADMTGARTYLQRGLRFCKGSRDLWIEYAKLEMIYIGKIEGRRRVLGIDNKPKQQAVEPVDALDADMIALPDVTLGELSPGPANDGVDISTALEGLKSSPALAGAIPRTIFDAATKQFPNDAALAERFFDLFADSTSLSCSRSLLEHVLHHLQAVAPTALPYLRCYFREPVLGVDHNSANFPSALRTSFQRLKSSLDDPSHAARLSESAIRWFLSTLKAQGLDQAIQTALLLMLRQTIARFKEAAAQDRSLKADEVAMLRQAINGAGFPDEAALLQQDDPR